MNRRNFIKATGGVAGAGLLAGCASDEPNKQCSGDCDQIVEWDWGYNSGGAFSSSSLRLVFIPRVSANPLEVEVFGYDGFNEQDLKYTATFTIEDRDTIIIEEAPYVERVAIRVKEQ